MDNKNNELTCTYILLILVKLTDEIKGKNDRVE
nr:MAG TPA: hypothetical protein [Caudoviricetes sp.]